MDAAAPLKTGSAFCVHHQPDKFTGSQCAGITKRSVRCRVFSGSLYAAAAPLRDGDTLCTVHRAQRHERVRCAGTTRGGRGGQCKVTSWTPFADAAPLRAGKRFCATHAHQDCAFVRCVLGSRASASHALSRAGTSTPVRSLCATAHRAQRHAAQAEQDEQPAPTSAAAGSYVPDSTVCASCGEVDELSKDPSDGTWYCQRCWDEWERDDPLASVWSTVLFGVPL